MRSSSDPSPADALCRDRPWYSGSSMLTNRLPEVSELNNVLLAWTRPLHADDRHRRSDKDNDVRTIMSSLDHSHDDECATMRGTTHAQQTRRYLFSCLLCWTQAQLSGRDSNNPLVRFYSEY